MGDVDHDGFDLTGTKAAKEPGIIVEILMERNCFKNHEDGGLATMMLVDKGKRVDPREHSGALASFDQTQ
jgi:hypothetical protein